VSVTAATIDWDLFTRATFDAVDAALRSAAESHPFDIQRRIFARIRPDGRAQKANAAATVKKKKHDQPLFHKGILSTPARYRVFPDGELRWVVEPPVERTAVIVEVRRLGYGVFDISSETDQHMRDGIQDGLDKVAARFGV
jgi:hypothetical protein